MSEFKCAEPGCEYHVGLGGPVVTDEDFEQQDYYFQEIEEHQQMHDEQKRVKPGTDKSHPPQGGRWLKVDDQPRLMFSCDRCTWKIAIYFDRERREGARFLSLIARLLNKALPIMGELHRWSHSSFGWQGFLGRFRATFRVRSICLRHGSK